MLGEKRERTVRKILGQHGITPERLVNALEKQFAMFCHRLRDEGMSRDKISTRLHVNFGLIKYIFERHPYKDKEQTISCACGCGRTFKAGNGRRYYDGYRCREKHISNGGEVKVRKTKTSHRQTYCHQNIDGDYTECANYHNTCGADCLRMENGKPCCFVMPRLTDSQGFRYQAVDYNGSTAMPGLRAFRG